MCVSGAGERCFCILSLLSWYNCGVYGGFRLCNLKALAFVIWWEEFKLITDILTSCRNLDCLYAIFYWLYWCTCHTKVETSHLTHMGTIFSINSYRCFSLLYSENSTLFWKLFFFSSILHYSFIYLSIKKKEL